MSVSLSALRADQPTFTHDDSWYLFMIEVESAPVLLWGWEN
jgi:hypothetical protein